MFLYHRTTAQINSLTLQRMKAENSRNRFYHQHLRSRRIVSKPSVSDAESHKLESKRQGLSLYYGVLTEGYPINTFSVRK